MITDPGRVAIVGDWHGNAYWGQQMLDSCAARDVKTVLHLGDFGLWPGYLGKGYLNRLDEYLVKNDQTVYWLDGNHDDHDRLDTLQPQPNGLHEIRDRIWHLPRGFRWSWYGRTWLALGGAHSVDRQLRTAHANWWPREIVSPEEELHAVEGGPVDVMVCHDAPLGIPLLEERLAANAGGWPQEELRLSRLHRQLIRRVVDSVRPVVLYHGHYHWRYDDNLVLDDGHAVRIAGLDCDNTSFRRNVIFVDAELAADRA